MSDLDELRYWWCDDPSMAIELGRFFVDTVSPGYISHTELRDGRASDLGVWHPRILDLVTREIHERIDSRRGQIAPGAPSLPVLVVRRGGRLVAMAMVTFELGASVPYAVLEDLLVAGTDRRQGIATSVVDWVVTQARDLGCRRIFLESGIDQGSHGLYRRLGFETCSVVMMKGLDATR